MQSLQDLLQQKPINSINRNKVTNNNIYRKNDIEIPVEIEQLVDNKMYLPRHKKLIREHGLEVMLRVAKMAQSADKPSRFYAVATSVKNWAMTLKNVMKQIEVEKLAMAVKERIAAPIESMKLVYKACWMYGRRVEKWAVDAQEIGKNPVKLFAWYYGRAGGTPKPI